MTGKTWFITGASRGFGRIWAEAALKRGDRVAATARNLITLAELSDRYGGSVLPLVLDVTNPEQVAEAVAETQAHFGSLDILVNSAGYALFGAIEEASETDIRAEFDTNVFGALRVIRAALPLMRRQGYGRILGVSSVAGIVASPMIGYYHASKWAFEAIHESLAQEVKSFGIKVTLLEPGAYATGFSSQASLIISGGMPEYSTLKSKVFEAGAMMEFGDPDATAEAVMKIADSEEPPLRFFLGTEGLPVAREAYTSRLATWESWEVLSNEAQGAPRKVDIGSL